MEIGELLKKYRLMHAETKKAWAGSVLSPSFYARVEKGTNRISANDLINLLHANNIAKGDSPNKEEHLMLLEIYIAIIDDDYASIDDSTLKKAKERIFATSIFDADTLKLYCNCISFYDLDENLIICKRAVTQFKSNNSITMQKNILAIIINILIFCIKAKRYEETDFYINSAEEIATTPEIYFYKTILLFFKNLLQYHQKSEKQYLDQCYDIIQNIALSGMTKYSSSLKVFLEENK